MSMKISITFVLALSLPLILEPRSASEAAPPGSGLADVQVNRDLVGLQQAETSVAFRGGPKVRRAPEPDAVRPAWPGRNREA